MFNNLKYDVNAIGGRAFILRSCKLGLLLLSCCLPLWLTSSYLSLRVLGGQSFQILPAQIQTSTGYSPPRIAQGSTPHAPIHIIHIIGEN